MKILDGSLELIAPTSPWGQFKFVDECNECLYGVSWSSEFRTRGIARRQESAPRLLSATTIRWATAKQLEPGRALTEYVGNH